MFKSKFLPYLFGEYYLFKYLYDLIVNIKFNYIIVCEYI